MKTQTFKNIPNALAYYFNLKKIEQLENQTKDITGGIDLKYHKDIIKMHYAYSRVLIKNRNDGII